MCGFISARGDFADSPDSLLARSQRVHGGKSTFGLKLRIDAGSDYVLGHRPTERGTFNFRWPLVEYRLERRGFEPGLCSVFSYVKDGVLFQIMRLMPGLPLGPVNSAIMDDNEPGLHVAITAGGRFHFGCRCHGLEPGEYTVGHAGHGYVRTLRNGRLSQALAMQVFVDGIPIELESEESTVDRGGTDFGDTTFATSVALIPGDPTVIVASFGFCPPDSVGHRLPCPDSLDLWSYVGCGVDCENATDWLWREKLDNGAEKAEFNSYFTEICLVGRCLERLLYVNYVPMETGSPEHPHGVALLNSMGTDSRVDFQSFLYVSGSAASVSDYGLTLSMQLANTVSHPGP